jgi:hypothetical protein
MAIGVYVNDVTGAGELATPLAGYRVSDVMPIDSVKMTGGIGVGTIVGMGVGVGRIVVDCHTMNL